MKASASIGIILLLVLSVPVLGTAEFRGLYVDAWHPGFKNHEQVVEMVNTAKNANFNALFIQVRKRADAYYDSRVEPRAADIAPDYDPLADVIREAHAVGLEVHAWLIVYHVGHVKPELPPNSVARVHPEWLTKDRDGNTAFNSGKIYLDPGVPAVQDYIVSIVSDIVSRYDVDGVHLERLQYPDSGGGFNATSIALFNQQSGKTGRPDPHDKEWLQWCRGEVTGLVRRIHNTVISTKPRVKLSAITCHCSARGAKEQYLQEWDVWLRDGLVDFMVPMLYTKKDSIADKVPFSVASASNRHIYIGIGGHQISTTTADQHIDDGRLGGGEGFVLFSYYTGSLYSGECAKIADIASLSEPAEIPAMPWK